MKENINNSRLIVNAWNPAEITETTLAPCHTGFQVVGCNEVLNYIGHKDQLMCFLVYHLT
jgi:thymidylate synthase